MNKGSLCFGYTFYSLAVVNHYSWAAWIWGVCLSIAVCWQVVGFCKWSNYVCEVCVLFFGRMDGMLKKCLERMNRCMVSRHHSSHPLRVTHCSYKRRTPKIIS